MKNIDLILNKVCNLNCFFCNPSKYTKDFFWSDKNNIILKIADFFNKWFESITFSWWEPTLDNNLLLYIKFANKIGFKIIKLQTNLTLLNKEKLDLLSKSWLNEIWFTYLWNQKKVFKDIVWNDKYFDNYINSLDLLEDFKDNIKITCDIVLNDFLVDDLENIINLLLKKWIKHINFKYPFYTWKKHMENRIKNYSSILISFLQTIDISYNILYIPTCYLNWLEEKIYDYENDYIMDWEYIFSLKDTLNNVFYKENQCNECIYKINCFWLEKWLKLELIPTKNYG